nr:unnamed protein product [Digitaria exilis]
MLCGPKYDGEALHRIIRKELEGITLDDTVTRIMVPTFDVFDRSVRVFDSGATAEPLREIDLADICIATTAAPIYFPAHDFNNNVEDSDKKEEEYIKHNLIDGGVAANNPTLDAIWCMMRQVINGPSQDNNLKPYFEKCFVISIGTGSGKHKYKAKECARWGIIGWLYKDGHTPLLDIFSKNTASLIHYTTGFLFYVYDCQKNYLRIDPELTSDAAKKPDTALDNATEENMELLIKEGNDLLTEKVRTVIYGDSVWKSTTVESNETNEEALRRFAGYLCEERHKRLRDQN